MWVKKGTCILIHRHIWMGSLVLLSSFIIFYPLTWDFLSIKPAKSQARINVLESHWLDGENILEYIGIYYIILLYNIIEYIWNIYIYTHNILLYIYMEYNIIEYILLYNIIELYLWNIYTVYNIISNPEKDSEEIDPSMLPPMFFYI